MKNKTTDCQFSSGASGQLIGSFIQLCNHKCLQLVCIFLQLEAMAGANGFKQT